MSIERKVEVRVSPTPEELAQEWWRMGEREQAMFFNELARVAGADLVMQLQALTDSGHLQDSARHVMRMIGDYAPKQPA